MCAGAPWAGSWHGAWHMEPEISCTQKLALVPATPNPQLLWVFARDDFQGRSQEIPLAILLESQSLRGL